MKHFYTLILTFISLLYYSQVINPQTLVGKDWRLFKITSNQTEYLPPAPVNILESQMLYSNGNYYFYPRYYNSGSCAVTFTSNENSFTYQYSQFPFIYQGENSDAVNAYDTRMLDFYRLYVGQKYNYEYLVETNAEYLTITNPVGDKMFFRNTDLLSTTETGNLAFKVYPNPVQKILKIQGQERITSIAITDVSGKLVKQQKFDSKNPEINVESLAPDVYYLKINDNKAQKIIKK
ncbi:T9SS type A sorting domain-containing protein [Chryseobacterium sp. FH1]|uniref:T9SS type A sorting domain-containing protein n=1 Tax=Chryseobacterium sp. FH1 TaxID=1233951 RepID=UPI0004E3FCD3|nr:T9SS type A sorting domain-containing protein [Chryseobacterium sp. FH1]KFC24594.1 hypothetical protein IO90_00320 [Chryseobacterium sp. FH1]